MRIFQKYKAIDKSFTITSNSQIEKLSFLELAIILKDFKTHELKQVMQYHVKSLLEKGKI